MASKKAAIPAAEFTGDRPDIEHAPKLRDIAGMEEKLTTLLDAAEGEVTPEIEAIMAELEQDRPAFFERWALALRNVEARLEYLTGQASPFGTEYDRITEKANAVKADIERSRKRLHWEMTKRGIREVNGKLISIFVRTNPPAAANCETVPTDVLEKLYNDPETRHFIKYTPESFVLDKDEVKKAVATDLLPDELIAHNVGVTRGEKLEFK